MKLAYRALPAAAAAGIITLTACSTSTNPGAAANLQACKDFGAYKAAESASEFPAVAAHTLHVYLTDGPGNINTNVGAPQRHVLARILTYEAGYNTGGNVYSDETDVRTASADCAVVKATDGKKN